MPAKGRLPFSPITPNHKVLKELFPFCRFLRHCICRRRYGSASCHLTLSGDLLPTASNTAGSHHRPPPPAVRTPLPPLRSGEEEASNTTASRRPDRGSVMSSPAPPPSAPPSWLAPGGLLSCSSEPRPPFSDTSSDKACQSANRNPHGCPPDKEGRHMRKDIWTGWWAKTRVVTRPCTRVSRRNPHP